MLRRTEMIDSPSQKEAAAQIPCGGLLFGSDKPAETQPAAQQEEEQHFTQHRQP